MKFENNIVNLFDIYCDKINLHSKNFSKKNLKKSIELIKEVKKKNLKLFYLVMGEVAQLQIT